MMQLWFRQLGGQKWLLAGEDGNEFESVADAFAEAQAMANLGTPWNGATFRVVEQDGDEHAQTCWRLREVEGRCDCREPEVVAEQVFLADPPLPGEAFDGVGHLRDYVAIDKDGVLFEKLGTGSLYGALKQRETLKKNSLAGIAREIDKMRLNSVYGKAGQRASKATSRVFLGAREMLEHQAFQGALRSFDAVSAYPKELVWRRGTIETTGEEVVDGEKKP